MNKATKQIGEITIGGDGLFAGQSIYIDPALPPDTVEMRSGANRLRLDMKTGETMKIMVRKCICCGAPWYEVDH